MTSTPRRTNSQSEELPRELIELGQQIAELSPGATSDLDAAYNRVVDSVKRRRRILALVQEALSQLRLDIKYLMFDLEVTRKERDELREQLDSLTGDHLSLVLRGTGPTTPRPGTLSSSDVVPFSQITAAHGLHSAVCCGTVGS